LRPDRAGEAADQCRTLVRSQRNEIPVARRVRKMLSYSPQPVPLTAWSAHRGPALFHRLVSRPPMHPATPLATVNICEDSPHRHWQTKKAGDAQANMTGLLVEPNLPRHTMMMRSISLVPGSTW
jgi:hypothetical protein